MYYFRAVGSVKLLSIFAAMEKEVIVRKVSILIEEIHALNKSLFSSEDAISQQTTLGLLKAQARYLQELIELLPHHESILSASTEPIAVVTPAAVTSPVSIPVPPVPSPAPLASAPTQPEAAPKEVAKPAPKTDLQKLIGLNDRLLLIKKLFGGEQPKFEAAMAALAAADSLSSASALLVEMQGANANWEEEEELVNYLKFLLKRYFNG